MASMRARQCDRYGYVFDLKNAELNVYRNRSDEVSTRWFGDITFKAGEKVGVIFLTRDQLQMLVDKGIITKEVSNNG